MRLFNILKTLALKVNRIENATVLRNVNYTFGDNHIAEQDGYIRIYCPYTPVVSGKIFTVKVEESIVANIRPDATNSMTLGGIFIKKGTKFSVSAGVGIPNNASLSFLELGGVAKTLINRAIGGVIYAFV